MCTGEAAMVEEYVRKVEVRLTPGVGRIVAQTIRDFHANLATNGPTPRILVRRS
jgi:hypothetical protein